MNIRRTLSTLSAAAASMAVFLVPVSVAAATNTVVTPANQQGWSSTGPGTDTRPGGAVNFVVDFSSPAPTGALQLTTDATTNAKAQYFHAANTNLSGVNDLSYYTKQVSAPFPGADASYQLPVYLNGTSGFSTLVFEPYQNPGNNGNASVVNNVWQKWDVGAGKFYSTRPVDCTSTGGTILPGSTTGGGPAIYSLTDIKTACPQAKVLGFGVNIGTNNPSYNVETDLFNFNGTVYDFEARPQSKDDCKNGGYAKFTNPSFKNQGDCVSYVSGNKNKNKNSNKVNIQNNNNQNASSGNANVSGNTNGGSASSGSASNSSNSSSNVSITN